jgi:hypothetical protein
MKHLNFAQKVTLHEQNTTVDTGAFNPKKNDVWREINKHKVLIDFSAFEKHKEEIKELKKQKSEFKKNPTKGREEVLQAFVDSSIPNWGNLNFIVLN